MSRMNRMNHMSDRKTSSKTYHKTTHGIRTDSLVLYNDIQKRCIQDHKQYIKSYIAHNTKKEIKDNYHRGIERYTAMKELMKDVTIHYPQIMSFMLNPQDSDASQDSLCQSIKNGSSEIQPEVNFAQGIQTGGNKQQMMQVIDKIKGMFESVKRIDTVKMKELTDELIKKLDNIDSKLDQIASDNQNIADPDTVVNNLSTVLTSLDKFDPTQSSYTKLTSAHDLYAPLKTFDEPDLASITTLSDVLSDLVHNYMDVIGMSPGLSELVKVVISKGSSKDIKDALIAQRSKTVSSDPHNIKPLINQIILKIDNTNQNVKFIDLRTQIFAEFIKPIMDGIETMMDSEKVNLINNRYTDTETQIDKKIKELEEVTAKLKTASDSTEKSLYGDSDNPMVVKKFASIRSNMLPKLREIVGMCELYTTVMKDGDKSSGKLSELLKKYTSINISTEPLYKKDIDKIFKRLLEHLNLYKTELKQHVPKSENLREHLTRFINECAKVDVNTKISIFNGKIADKQIGDFIEYYNKMMNTSEGKLIVDNLNIFMAEMWRQVVAKKLGLSNSVPARDLAAKGEVYCKDAENTNKMCTVIRELNVKKVKSFVAWKDDFSTVRPIFEDMLEKAYGYDVKLRESGGQLIQDLKKEELFINGLKTEIKDVRSARMFIHLYNQTMYSRDLIGLLSLGFTSGIRLIPYCYFLKDYTDRIYNNIFKDLNEHRDSKSQMLDDLIEKSLEISDPEALDMIYEPDFKKIKAAMKKEHGRQSSQFGGTINQIEKNIVALGNKKLILLNGVQKYKQEADRYIVTYNDVYSYTRYLILIATNQFFTENYVVYNYLNKGLIELYKRIVNNIIRDLDSGVSESHIIYIRKYYNVVVRRLYELLKNLSVFMTDSQDIIDIRNIDTTSLEIRNDMILLNYFKPIIESYNEIFQNQITIYARLNDIAGDIDYDSKVFVSDHEKFKTMGCGYDILSNASPSDLSALCLPSKTADIGMGGNSAIMWTKSDTCDAVASQQLSDQSTMFTEVFDTVNFPENGDISKYMTLETQLAKKKGVCVLTYGYSGTGKTYTLFGNRDKLGILQSTLVNISGLYKVKFRLFEIYGKGLPYDFYWNDTEAGVSRMAKIDHHIFHYKLQTANSMIEVQKNVADDLTKIYPSDFLNYIENKKTYLTINGTEVKNVFNNFATFTESIDKYRKGEKGTSDIKNIKRIRETPNNPESSRSILVYDFKLYVGEDSGDELKNEEDAVKFLIIDLPGREEIKQTYIEPYLENPLIKNMLKQGEDKTINLSPTKTVEANYAIERIRMIISCMALNPMALAVFHPRIIVDTINTEVLETRTSVYGNVNGKGDITEEYEINDKQAKLSLFVKLIDMKMYHTNHMKGFGYNTMFQILGVGAIYVIYRLIEQNRFDLLEKIYKNIVKIEINDVIDNAINKINTDINSEDLFQIIQGLVATRFKGEKTSKMLDELVRELTSSIPASGLTTLEYIDANKAEIIALKTDSDDHKIELIKSSLKKIINYDYLMTPLEGIYINENIIGLIKYLSERLIKDPTARTKIDVLNKNTVQQKKMILVEQRNVARCWLMSKSEDDMAQILQKNNPMKLTNLQKMFALFNIEDVYAKSYFPWSSEKRYFNNIYSSLYEFIPTLPNVLNKSFDSSSLGEDKLMIRFEQLVKQQRFLITAYTSDKIFNFDDPIITNILSPYIESDKKDAIHNKTAIKDYKLFYLFGNYDENQKTQFKCDHQIKLLKNTENFIKAIAH